MLILGPNNRVYDNRCLKNIQISLRKDFKMLQKDVDRVKYTL